MRRQGFLATVGMIGSGMIGLGVIGLGVIGCGQLQNRLVNNAPIDGFVPNPIQVPALKDDFVWNQTVDTLDDYFRIASEQPLVSSGGIISDGRLETIYQVGGSVFEPWRKDSTAGFERLQSTLQSVRRRAIVTVRPAAATGAIDTYLGPGSFQSGQSPGPAAGLGANVDGYVIEVVVTKDLEDADERALASTQGDSIAQRHDGTIVRRDDLLDSSPVTLGWIPLGRDEQLEQRILSDLFGRLTRDDATKHGL
jgi:hypothetical protein